MAIYKFPTSEPNFIESWTINLEANRPYPLEAYGRTFACVVADVPFQMCFNNGKYFDVRRGAEWQLQQDERFNILKFISATAQTIQILTGNFFYHENVVIPLMQVAKTRAIPGAASSIAAGATIDLTTVPAGYTYRKGVIISNNDAGVDLDIYTQDATNTWQLAGTVLHQQQWYVETSDAVRIKNPSLGTVNVRIMELFYFSQF